jgi:hypothetical protein
MIVEKKFVSRLLYLSFSMLKYRINQSQRNGNMLEFFFVFVVFYGEVFFPLGNIKWGMNANEIERRF